MRTLVFVLALALPWAAHAVNFSIESPDIKPAKPVPESHVFNGFGCEGGNLSPTLMWEHPPKGTRSFAVTVYDPDAPTGSGWWHWVMFNPCLSGCHTQNSPAFACNRCATTDGTDLSSLGADGRESP